MRSVAGSSAFAVTVLVVVGFLAIGCGPTDPLVVAPPAPAVTASGRAGGEDPVVGPLRDVSSDGDLGDPFVLADGGPGRPRYVVYGTSDWRRRIPTAVSDDLLHWRASGDALPELPAWARPDPDFAQSWGPAVLRAGAGYRLYYSTLDRGGRQCISVAAAAGSVGPFVDGSTAPLLCQADLGGSIDPSPVRRGDGAVFLLWKSDGAPGSSTKPAIWSQRLTGDGSRLVGPRHLLLGASGAAWQEGVIEGPTMARLDGRWWLFFSAGRWDTDRYAIGATRCAGPAGPCAAESSPVISPSRRLIGPGGPEAFVAADGRPWLVLHSWRWSGDWATSSRQIHLAPLGRPYA